MFKIDIEPGARESLAKLKKDKSQEKRFKAVKKALRLLKDNPRHPSLHTHQWKGETCDDGAKIWEAYAENRTPSAYRIFFRYHATESDKIVVLAVTPHP